MMQRRGSAYNEGRGGEFEDKLTSNKAVIKLYTWLEFGSRLLVDV